MELKGFLHMKQGDEQFSYSSNAIVQTSAASRMKPTMEKAIESLLNNEIGKSSMEALKIADLGCGVGPVPLSLISTVIQVVRNKCKQIMMDFDQVPEIHAYFNDLPSNDFNYLFKDLTTNLELKNQPLCLVMGVPGSFYDRLFPPNSLHFVHANFALHWLSQVPPGLYNEQGAPINKGNINLHEGSPPEVVKAYVNQFEQDWTRFLSHRSQEVVPNGVVLLLVRGRCPILNSTWELNLLAQALSSLVSKGWIEEEAWESFEFPCHCPLQEEIEEVVEREGSFEIELIETINDETIGHKFDHDVQAKAESITKCLWGFTSIVVSHHFGHQVSNAIYDELLQVTLNHLVEKKSINVLSIMVLLRKRCST